MNWVQRTIGAMVVLIIGAAIWVTFEYFPGWLHGSSAMLALRDFMREHWLLTLPLWFIVLQLALLMVGVDIISPLIRLAGHLKRRIAGTD